MANTKVLKAEAGTLKEDENLTAEFRGKKFILPKDVNDWSLDVMEAFEDGKMVTVIRGLLGDKQWAEIKAMDLKTSDFAELTESVLKAMGVDSEKSDS